MTENLTRARGMGLSSRSREVRVDRVRVSGVLLYLSWVFNSSYSRQRAMIVDFSLTLIMISVRVKQAESMREVTSLFTCLSNEQKLLL